MKLVAWQNMISPHQAPLLNALAKDPRVSSVTLVVEQELSRERAQMGWSVPELPDIEVLVAPDLAQLDGLKARFVDSEHLVSGFCQGRYGDWIRANLGHFFLYTELAKSDSLWRSWVNAMRYRYFYRRMANQIKGIFAIGSQCPIWLRDTLAIPNEKILPFGYFLQQNHQSTQPTQPSKGALFVGRLEPVKGIVPLLQQYLDDKCKYPLTIVGDGSQKDQVLELVAQSDSLIALGSASQADILQWLSEYELLVLPNQKEEGWGFVVNEALMNGTPVLCSDLTGARRAVKNAPYSQVLDHQNLAGFVSIINSLAERDFSALHRNALIDWYNQHLSVNAARDYLLTYMLNDSTVPIEVAKERYGWL